MEIGCLVKVWEQVFDIQNPHDIVFRPGENGYAGILVGGDDLEDFREWGAEIQVYNVGIGGHDVLYHLVPEVDDFLQHGVLAGAFVLHHQFLVDVFLMESADIPGV